MIDISVTLVRKRGSGNVPCPAITISIIHLNLVGGGETRRRGSRGWLEEAGKEKSIYFQRTSTAYISHISQHRLTTPKIKSNPHPPKNQSYQKKKKTKETSLSLMKTVILSEGLFAIVSSFIATVNVRSENTTWYAYHTITC